jgi:hypothetical protein
MMIGRRNFLQRVLGAIISAPSAVDVAKKHGFHVLGSSAPWVGAGETAGPPVERVGPQTTRSEDEEISLIKNALNFLDTQGIPEHKLTEMRQGNLWVSTLDPDLAINRSFSLPIKVMIQRERNFNRCVEQYRGYLRNSLNRTKFRKLFPEFFRWI